MEKDREARHAAMILAQSEYERHVRGREVDDDDFEAGWQAALAYARGERENLRSVTQRLIDAADGMAHSTNSGAADAAIEEARAAIAVVDAASPSWFAEDVKRASERQEKFDRERPSALAMVRDLAWREKGPALIEAARKASGKPYAIGVDFAAGPDTSTWYCSACGSSWEIKPDSPLNVSPQEKEPVAWMRKWAADGVNVMKLKKEDRPRGWAMHAVTVDKLLPDDVPLAIGGPSPVTGSSGCVFRDLNVSPLEKE